MSAKLDLEIRQDDDGQPILYFPFVSMSDIHLGTDACKAKRLCSWFEVMRTDNLMLVGDVVDGEALLEKKQWHFGGPWHRQALAHMVRRAGTGTKVIYPIGNHETGIREGTTHYKGRELPYRQLTGKALYGVDFVDHTYYKDPRGRNFLIVHGDKYDDHIFTSSKSRDTWYKRGDRAYTALYNIDTRLQKFSLLEEFSLAAQGKKIAKIFINKFMGINREIARAIDAMEGVDGVLYGHSHMGGFMRSRQNKLLMNDGCSTEHVQAQVHDRHGNWALLTIRKRGLTVEMEGGREYIVTWDSLGMGERFRAGPTLIADDYTKKADRLLRLIYRMWPPKDRTAMRAEIVRDAEIADTFRKLPILRRPVVDSGVAAPTMV